MSVDVHKINAAIYTKLAAASNLTGLLNAGSASVFAYLAPENEDPPYVVFHPQSPPRPTRVGGGAVAYETVLYTVKAITADQDSAQTAGSIATRIDETLDRLAALTITSYTLMRCERQQSISYPEVLSGKRFNHAGAVYRLELLPA